MALAVTALTLMGTNPGSASVARTHASQQAGRVSLLGGMGGGTLTGQFKNGLTYLGESPEDDNLLQYRLQVTDVGGQIGDADFELLVDGWPYSSGLVTYFQQRDIDPTRLAAFEAIEPQLADDAAAAATYTAELNGLTSPASIPAPTAQSGTDAYNGLQSAWRNLINTRLELVQHRAEAFPGSGGVEHDWNEYIPANVQDHPGVKVPLMVSLHGGGNSILLGEGLGFAFLGGQDDFITVEAGGYGEDAATDTGGVFNDTLSPTSPDDVGYLTALIKDEESTLPIDASRVYISGISNGGSMASIMALTDPGLFAGVGIISADGLEDAGGNGNIDAITPANIAAINASVGSGLELPVAYMTAGDDDGAWGPNVGTDDQLIAADQAAIGYWKLMDNIAPVPTWNYTYPWGQPLDNAGSVDRLGYTIDMGGLRSRGPAPQTLVELFNVETMFHANQPGGAELEWNFLSQFRRLANGDVIEVK